ncbi:MAG: hypothetical protein MdMp024_0727 [Bacteroidales bacterium]
MKRLYLTGLAFCLCSLNTTAAEHTAPASVAVTGIVLNTSTLTLTVNETAQLTATVIPADADNKAVYWVSNNEAVVTVSANGLVTAKAIGSAIVVASTQESDFGAMCEITVTSSVGATIQSGWIADIPAQTYTGHDITPDLVVNDGTRTLTPNVDYVVVGYSNNKNIGTATVTIEGIGGYNGTASKTFVIVAESSVIPVTGVSLDRTTLTLTTGETAQLTATVMPANATNRAVWWSSSDFNVVTVDNNGLVTATGAGAAAITVVTDNNAFMASCQVTVTSAPNPTIPVTGISLNSTTLTLTVGATAQLTATITPANATNQSVTWSSSNAGVATVNNGLVTATAAGSAFITAATADGGFTATCQVMVTAPATPTIPVTGISLNSTTLTLNTGATAQLTATITPYNATNQSVTWSSSNAGVATVSNGLVTATAAGTTAIAAATADGNFTAACWVTVTSSANPAIPVTGISLDRTTLTLSTGATMPLTPTIIPANATNQSVTWSSSNSGVATVSNGGLVTATSIGTTAVTAVTADGNFTAACWVTVTSPAISVTDISLDRTTLMLRPGETAQLTATITPSNATNQTVIWTSSDPDVATVYNGGLVIAKANGAATLIVMTEDGGKIAACKVTVSTGTGVAPAAAPVTAYVAGDVLYLNTPEQETVRLYSVAGSLLLHAIKPAGATQISLAEIPGGALIICGSSGWTIKTAK